MSTPASRSPSRRPELSIADIVRGVLVLAVGVLVVGWLAGLFRSDSVVERDPVDYVAVARQAQQVAGFDLAVPSTLPTGWRATSARWSDVEQAWHLGILTAEGEYVGIEQSAAGNSTAMAREHAEDATIAGTVEVGGLPWRRLVDARTGEVTLVRELPRSTTLVTGTAPEPTLVLVAGRLDG